MTGLKGIAAATDALLLLFQIRFTKHGLWHHTVPTARTALSATLVHFFVQWFTVMYEPIVFIVLSYDIPETASRVMRSTRTSTVLRPQLKFKIESTDGPKNTLSFNRSKRRSNKSGRFPS